MENIREANPLPSPDAKWKILIPGFPPNGKSPFSNNVQDAYLKRMQSFPYELYNILVVEWERDIMCQMNTYVENNNLTYNTVVGEKVANMLIFLHENHKLNLSEDTHIIGFSMGAHVTGEAARYVFQRFERRNLIYRISALDLSSDKFWPTQTEFNSGSPSPIHRIPRIRRSFVGYLDVYHTSRVYGIKKKIGDIDFIVNDGHWQPGSLSYFWKNAFFQGSNIDDFKG